MTSRKGYILAGPDMDPDMEDAAGRRSPDVSVRRTDLPHGPGNPGPGGATGTTLLEAALHQWFAAAEEVPQVTINIYDVADRSPVTAIAVLSPTDQARSTGRADYLAKRQRVFQSDAHLIEIDLLRAGRRLPMADPIPPTHYCVPITACQLLRANYCVPVSRADRRPITDVWPASVRQRLPTVPVPLLAADPDAGLDLQQALSAMSDAWAYDLELDDTRPPPVPLSPDDAAWAAELLARRL